MNENDKATLRMLQPTYADPSLIVPRGTLPIELHAELTSSDAVKLLIAGQRGMGKTTELRRLLQRFDVNETIPVFVQFGAQESITNAMLVGSMAGHLKGLIENPSSKTVKAIESLKAWFYSEEHSLTTQEEVSGTAELGGELKVLTASKGVRHSNQKSTKKTRETNRDLNDLIDRFNYLIATVRKSSNKKVIFIVDDIDKIQDMASIQNAFIHSAHVVNRIDAPCVFTVPITYATSSIVRIGALPYGEIYRVPAVEVVLENGQSNDVAVAFMREVLNRRMPSKAIPGPLLDKIIRCSGGVIVDALRIARNICKKHFLEGRLVDDGLFQEQFQKLVDDYVFVFDSPHLWKKLDVLCTTTSKSAIMTDDALPQLLYKMIAIEYREKSLWFDLHPAARELHRQKAAVIRQCKDLGV
jgi:GTPase SAR1 family protein